MGERIMCRYGDGKKRTFEVSEKDSYAMAKIVHVQRLLEKKIAQEYNKMHENISVYGQITSGQFKADAERVMEILDDILDDTIIGMEASYMLTVRNEELNETEEY